jgi:hypothetical protein
MTDLCCYNMNNSGSNTLGDVSLKKCGYTVEYGELHYLNLNKYIIARFLFARNAWSETHMYAASSKLVFKLNCV